MDWRSEVHKSLHAFAFAEHIKPFSPYRSDDPPKAPRSLLFSPQGPMRVPGDHWAAQRSKIDH